MEPLSIEKDPIVENQEAQAVVSLLDEFFATEHGDIRQDLEFSIFLTVAGFIVYVYPFGFPTSWDLDEMYGDKEFIKIKSDNGMWSVSESDISNSVFVDQVAELFGC